MNWVKFILFIGLLLGLVTLASAHVVVNPKTVNPAEFVRFSVGVPTEKNLPTISVRLVLPEGLKHVTPNVKTGWKIEASDTEIVWAGGLIPVGQRDEFGFSAQVPAGATTLKWKAYQTYSDDSVVSWNQDPNVLHSDGQMTTPYSQTEVIDDLSVESGSENKNKDNRLNIALSLSILALAVAIYSASRPR
jgi:uncharacterized protein YcnI